LYSTVTPSGPAGRSGIARAIALAAVLAVAGVLLAACGSNSSGGGSTSASKSGSTSASGSKLILAEQSFPCGLNGYAQLLCSGFDDAKKNMPAGYSFQLKAGVDGDTTAFNNIIETSLQLKPAGIIVYPNGPATETPMVKKACAQGIKVIIINDYIVGAGNGCVAATIKSNDYELGAQLGRWLIAHPPTISREVGIVNWPPGRFSGSDQRVKGFVDTITPAGYRVVASVSTDLTLTRTRTLVQNMLTGHPKLGTVFSTADGFGDGTAQAVRNPKIVQLSVDGALTSVRRIPSGGLSADNAQNPAFLARVAVQQMSELLQGRQIPSLTYAPGKVIDASNVEQYIAAGGLH